MRRTNEGYFNPETKRFGEHSIRALGAAYFSLFDVFHRAEMLDVLSPVDDYNFYEKATGKKVAIDRTEPIDLDTFKKLVKTFESQVVDLLVEVLEKRGVKFIYDSRMENIHQEKTGKIRIETVDKSSDTQLFDACIIAVPHETMWKVGLLDTQKPFDDEWSFGTQFPLEIVPENLEPFSGESYNLCFDAPWNIVFQIQHNGSFWSDIEFPETHPYNLSATCGSPFNKGSLYGKSFMNCTPDEALQEVLFQLGITDEQERGDLAKDAVVDPIYMKYTDDWQKYAELETVELGVLQANNHRWVDFSQIYVRSAEDPQISPKTKFDGVLLAGEVVTVPGNWEISTMEQAAQEVFDFLQTDHNVGMNFATSENKRAVKVAEAILGGLLALSRLVPGK